MAHGAGGVATGARSSVFRADQAGQIELDAAKAGLGAEAEWQAGLVGGDPDLAQPGRRGLAGGENLEPHRLARTGQSGDDLGRNGADDDCLEPVVGVEEVEAPFFTGLEAGQSQVVEE